MDLHETLASERREIPRDSTIGFAGIDTLKRRSNFEVARLAGLTIRVEYDLEVPVTIATEARGNIAQPLALSLSAGHTGFDPLDRPVPFFLGDGRTDIGDELPGPIGSNLVDPAVSDRDRRLSRFASLEKLLVDATQASEPRDLPDDDVVVLAGFNCRDEVSKLLATGICSGLREVDVPIDLRGIDIMLVELCVDRFALVGGLLGVGRGANVAGVAGHSRVVFVASPKVHKLSWVGCRL